MKVDTRVVQWFREHECEYKLCTTLIDNNVLTPNDTGCVINYMCLFVVRGSESNYCSEHLLYVHSPALLLPGSVLLA